MGALGTIYDQVALEVPGILEGEASVRCSLSDLNGNTLGAGAMASPSDPAYDPSDELRGLPSFIGVSYDPQTGLMISADSAELSLAQSSVSLGVPTKGWSGSMYNLDGGVFNFSVDACYPDRTLGIYRLALKQRKAAGMGRRVLRTVQSVYEPPAGVIPYNPNAEFELPEVDTFEELPIEPPDLTKYYLREFRMTVTYNSVEGAWYNEVGGIVTAEG